ncbi:hypothetical protein NHQ30_011344 [Ciborinia camelliae]|nr:hypothetical protein NHQ30_011344 [Ciborinia camelliae]
MWPGGQRKMDGKVRTVGEKTKTAAPSWLVLCTAIYGLVTACPIPTLERSNLIYAIEQMRTNDSDLYIGHAALNALASGINKAQVANGRHWQHTEAAIRAFEKISRLNDKQHQEDEAAKMEGRPRVKAAKVPHTIN